MRVIAIILTALLLFACGKADSVDSIDKGAYGEYETAVPDHAEGDVKPSKHTVEIVQMKFVPDVLNVSAGDTIVWVNRDFVQHDVTELSANLWTSKPLVTGAAWTLVLTKSQIYHCSLHVVMKGKIIVDGNNIAMLDVPVIAMCDARSRE
jgi:plastocyanin